MTQDETPRMTQDKGRRDGKQGLNPFWFYPASSACFDPASSAFRFNSYRAVKSWIRYRPCPFPERNTTGAVYGNDARTSSRINGGR